MGADPVLHSPTKFFISVEFKRSHVDEIVRRSWFAWERARRGDDEPIEVLVGGTKGSFLRYVRFEREAFGEDQGHRQLVAEKPLFSLFAGSQLPQAQISEQRLHLLSTEFQLSSDEILDVIANARRLKMAVRGWVAEEHLARQLRSVQGVTHCLRDDAEGAPDIVLRYCGQDFSVECKNVLRKRDCSGAPRLDFQRTRASKGDHCSRYYKQGDFDIVAACLHAVTEKWEYRFVLPQQLKPHGKCPGRLASNVRIDEQWGDLGGLGAILSDLTKAGSAAR